jgi:hypothetical protein
MQEITKAIIKARSGFKPIAKDRTNPHYKSTYATLDSVLEAVKPGLDAAGLAIAQLIETNEQGRTFLVTNLMHESGEVLKSAFPLPDTQDPQKLGSAITYARRYSVCAILSVTADEDDDGNSGAGDGNSKGLSTSAPTKKPAQGCISEKQISRLMAISKQSGMSLNGLKALVNEFGYQSRVEIKMGEHYDEICSRAGNPEFVEYYETLAQSLKEDAA